MRGRRDQEGGREERKGERGLREEDRGKGKNAARLYIERCTCSPQKGHHNRPITYSFVVVKFLEDSDAILQAIPVARVKHLKDSSEIFFCEVF